MDNSDQNLGNSPGDDLRGRLHIVLKNKADEPIPVTFSGTISVALDHDSDSVSIWGTDGTVDRKIKTNALGQLEISFPASIEVTQGTSPWVIDGTVAVNNFPATQPVSGTVAVTQSTSPWVTSVTGTVAVTGPLTDTQLRASPVPVSGTVAVTQTTSPWVVSGTVAVSNFPATQPVSGTVAVTQSTSPWVVSGTVAVSNQLSNGASVTGTITANQTVQISTVGLATALAEITGVGWSGTLQFEGTVDGVNWDVTNGFSLIALDGQPLVSATSNGQYQFGIAGYAAFRVRGVGITGTATINLGTAIGSDMITGILSYTFAQANMRNGAGTPLTSTNSGAIEALDVSNLDFRTMNQAFTKSVAIGGQLDDVGTTAATENNIAPMRITAQRAAHINLRNNAGTEIGTVGAPVRVDPTGTTTQPVSGTVTANIGTSGSLALEATQTAQNVLVGAVTETAPVSDTASSGLNGRLQRIAQRITSMIAQLPATIGQKLMAASLSVTIASDQSAVPVTKTKVALTPSGPTNASVGVATASAVAANANRKGLVITNTSVNTVSLGMGAAAVLNSGITLYPGGVFVMDDYTFTTVVINAIASAAASNISVQEFT